MSVGGPRRAIENCPLLRTAKTEIISDHALQRRSDALRIQAIVPESGQRIVYLTARYSLNLLTLPFPFRFLKAISELSERAVILR